MSGFQVTFSTQDGTLVPELHSEITVYRRKEITKSLHQAEAVDIAYWEMPSID